MATVYPFRALRPRPAEAGCIAAPPYDVVSTGEARELAGNNPLSFLRVSRPEIELPPDTNPYADIVYARAAANFSRLRNDAFVLEDAPTVYLYRLRMGAHEQLGLAACFSLDEYERDIIKRHERTRRDKEDDRTRHMLAVGAQTGPVFLTYRSSRSINDLTARVVLNEALCDFDARDGARHTVWRAPGVDSTALVGAFRSVSSLYIADGHHRAASAARAREEIRRKGTPRPSLGDEADFNTLLAVAFPDDQVQILAYNRVVRDLGGLGADEFVRRVAERFDMQSGTESPRRRGEIAMYWQRAWWALVPRSGGDPTDVVAGLDVSVLQEDLLAPILGIDDVRTSTRIDFVGGSRGPAELQRIVDSGAAAVAFSMFPVSISDLIAVSDAGAMLPPKSTWFEPKLRDGLLIHVI